MRWEAEEFIEAAGDRLVTVQTAYMRGRDDIVVPTRGAWLWLFRDGRIARITFFQERHEALEAAGLEESISGEQVGLVVGAGDGETMSGPLGGDVRFVVRGSDSAGALTVLEVANPAGQGPPLHVHPAQDETVHVLEGELRWRLGDEVRSTGRGAFVFIPRGLPHCFQVMGERSARMLVTFAPAGMEAFFERLSAMVEFDPAEFRAAAAESGMQVVGPPLAESHPIE